MLGADCGNGNIYVSDNSQAGLAKKRMHRKTTFTCVGDKYLSYLGKQSTYTLLLIDAVQDSIKLFHAIGVDPEEPAWMTEKSSFIMDWLPDNATLSTVELITAIWALYLGYIYNILDSHKKGMIKRNFVP